MGYHSYKVATGPDPTEFEIQAVVYMLLKAKWPKTRGEFSLRVDSGISKGVRFDVVVFDDFDQIKVIVEVKKGGCKKGDRGWNEWVEQINWYHQITDAPVLLVKGMDEAQMIVARVEEAIKRGRYASDA